MIHLLIVDDEQITREALMECIDWAGIGIGRVETARNGVDALARLACFVPDILLCDVRMPKMNGIELAEQVRRLVPACRIIFLSGFSDKEYLKSAIAVQAVQYLEKPLNFPQIEGVVGQTVVHVREAQRTALELERLRGQNGINGTASGSVTGSVTGSATGSTSGDKDPVGDVAGDMAGNARIRAIQHHIETEYANPSLGVQSIAARFFLTPSYLCAFYKKHTDRTVIETITAVRMNRALVLLRDLRLKLPEVARSVGYQDPNYFSCIFKRHFGRTVSEYRESLGMDALLIRPEECRQEETP